MRHMALALSAMKARYRSSLCRSSSSSCLRSSSAAARDANISRMAFGTSGSANGLAIDAHQDAEREPAGVHQRDSDICLRVPLGKHRVGGKSFLRLCPANAWFAESGLCGGTACQFVFKADGPAVQAGRQGFHAFDMAAQELSDINAVCLQHLRQMLHHGAEELIADGGRYPARDLQNAAGLWRHGCWEPLVRFGRSLTSCPLDGPPATLGR